MKKITLLDGAFGTEIWKLAEENGLEKVSTWRYAIEHPELVEKIHAAYSRAGSELIYADTFTANIENCGAEGFDAEEVIHAAIKLAKSGAALGAKQAAEDAAASGGELSEPAPRKVALDIGPLFKALEPFGDVTETQCREIYRKACAAGAAAGADLIVIETFMDTDMLRIAAEEAIIELLEEED